MSKKRRGDRWDGEMVRGQDAMHFICPMLYPNRCDNEAFISETIDLTHANEFLAKKNAEGHEYKYNLFQIIVTATMKTLTLRPKMNWFIANKTLYKRNELTASFVVNKHFTDDSEEGLAVIHTSPDDTLDTLHEKIYKQVKINRSINDSEKDPSTKAMDFFAQKLPRGLARAIVSFVCWLDKHGWVPRSFIETDPYYTSVVLSNLGSIGLHTGYHHLVNWGTNSVFVAIGEIAKRPFFNDDGTYEMKESVDLGLTIDERIADGYYYSKTVRLLKKLIEEPELLETPLNEEVDY